ANCGFHDILQHEREGEVICEVQIIIAFDEIFMRTVPKVGVRIANPPGIERIDGERRLKTEAAADENHPVANASDITIAVTAENREARHDLLIEADAITRLLGARAVVQAAPNAVIAFLQPEWPRHIGYFRKFIERIRQTCGRRVALLNPQFEA